MAGLDTDEARASLKAQIFIKPILCEYLRIKQVELHT